MAVKSTKAKRPSAKSGCSGQVKSGATKSRSNKSQTCKVARSDSQIPTMAHKAVARASRRANAAGLDKVVVTGTKLVRVSHHGQRTFVKNIEPDVPVRVGQKITLR